MKIPGKEIFKDEKVLLIGYSRNPSGFSRMVYHQFEDAGISVTPYNPNSGDYDVEVYNNFSDIKEMPEVATAILGKESLESSIDEIVNSGIKRLIVNSKGAVTQKVIDKCNEKGVDLDVFCPLLIVGTGFHKVHKFFATLF